MRSGNDWSRQASSIRPQSDFPYVRLAHPRGPAGPGHRRRSRRRRDQSGRPAHPLDRPIRPCLVERGRVGPHGRLAVRSIGHTRHGSAGRWTSEAQGDRLCPRRRGRRVRTVGPLEWLSPAGGRTGPAGSRPWTPAGHHGDGAQPVLTPEDGPRRGDPLRECGGRRRTRISHHLFDRAVLRLSCRLLVRRHHGRLSPRSRRPRPPGALRRPLPAVRLPGYDHARYGCCRRIRCAQ